MGLSRSRLRFPLPPELRKRFKAEMRKHAAERAKKVGLARQLRSSRIADAKAICAGEMALADSDYKQKRQQALAFYEAKAAELAVAADLAAT